jgi:plastocyanin
MRSGLLLGSLCLGLGLLACDDPGRSTQPSEPLRTQPVPEASNGGLFQEIQVRDACSPSFNRFVGPGTCIRKEGLPFLRFIAILTKEKSVGAWKFDPDQQEVKRGATLEVHNRGGEVHSFTRVARFGGGVVDLLNQLSGNPVPRPECLALQPQGFLPPGAVERLRVGSAGVERYQCCIHPWMRSTITVRRQS